MPSSMLPGYVSQERFDELSLSRFRGCRAADALTRAAPFGRKIGYGIKIHNDVS